MNKDMTKEIKERKGYLIPDWHVPNSIRAVVTTRVSNHSLWLPSEPIWVNQVHGKKVICADNAKKNNKIIEADGLYTRKTNTICAIRTADCLPVFITDTRGSIVSLVHAGWRGLAKNILPEMIKKLRVPPPDLRVFLGPAIGPNCFEVGKDVHDCFSDYPDGFRRISEKKWLANIYILARDQLHKLGVKDIHGGHECTYTDKERFYSFRRDQEKAGRIVSLIWREPS